MKLSGHVCKEQPAMPEAGHGRSTLFTCTQLLNTHTVSLLLIGVRNTHQLELSKAAHDLHRLRVLLQALQQLAHVHLIASGELFHCD